jgi:adhesin transport system outer membrane protein
MFRPDPLTTAGGCAGSVRAPARRTRVVALAAVALVQAALHGAPARATPLDEVVRAAVTDFPTIRAAQANRSAAEFRVEGARAGHYPTLDVGAVGRVTGASQSTPLPRARVNVFAGGAIEASVDREAQRVAALESREVATRDDVAFGAAQAYLRTLRAARLVRVSEANLERHARLAEDFEQIVRLDVGRRFDLVQAQARLQAVRGTLEDRLAELGTARQSLARFYPQPLDVARMTLPAVAELPVEPAAAIGSQEHPAVETARREVTAAEANARATRLQRRPRLDFEATGGRDPLSQVVLSWPAFDASLTAAEQGAVAARIGAEASLQDVEITIAEQRRQADVDFAAAGRRIVQARTQVQLATELVTIYYEQFRVGRRNLLDLLAAYGELSNGEAALVGAQVDQALARYRIAYTTASFAPRFEDRFAALPDVAMPEPASVPPFRAASAPRLAPTLQPPGPSRPAEPAPAPAPARPAAPAAGEPAAATPALPAAPAPR